MKSTHLVFSILVIAVFGFAITGHAQTATITYTYDDLNRLTNVSYAGGVSDNQAGITQTFTPNDAGNITASTVTTAPVDGQGVNQTTWAFFGNTSSCNCGIPDAWAFTYGLDWYDPNLASEDPNNDGLTNLQEYQSGGDPDYPVIDISTSTGTGTGYTSLQAAYNAAQNGDTILIQSVQLVGDFNANQGISVTIYGGNGNDLNNGVTTIVGAVTISSGTVIMSNCIIAN